VGNLAGGSSSLSLAGSSIIAPLATESVSAAIASLVDGAWAGSIGDSRSVALRFHVGLSEAD
jgi:hypothetical protein